MKNIHEVNIQELNNGIKLIHVFIPNFPVAISSFWLKVGSRNDPRGQEGTAHIFEHLLLTKTKDFPDRQKRLVEVEKRGFLYDAFTSLETSHYFYVHPNDGLDKAIDFLIDGYTSSIFEKEDLEEEKQVIIDEERRNYNDPDSYMWRLANSALWPNSQIGSNFYGNALSLGKITKDDIGNFYAGHYQTQNSTFVPINSIRDIDSQAIKIEKINKSNRVLLSKSSSELGSKKDIVFEHRDIDRSLLSLSFITCSGLQYRDCLILELIKNYLASGWTSRLISRLRVENKLTYWVEGKSDNLSDTGFVRFTTSVDNKNILETVKIFEEEIFSLKTKEINNKVLKNHKNRFRSELMMNCLSTNFLNWWYGSNLAVFGRPLPSVRQYIEDLDGVLGDEINSVAKKYLNSERFSIAVMGKKQLLDKIPTFQ